MPASIHERLPPLRRALGISGLLSFFASLAAGVWLVHASMSGERPDPWLFAGGIAMLIAGPLFFGLRLSIFWPFVRHGGPLPGIAIEHGRVKYLSGDAVTREFALADCGWFQASPTRRNIPRKEDIPVVQELMALCDLSGMYWKGIKLCGFTPEMREIWTAFLVLAGVRKKQ